MHRIWDRNSHRILQPSAIVLAVLFVLILGFLVLFPVFAKPGFRDPGMLLDGMGQPLANKRITVRWNGKVAEVATNKRGGFELPDQTYVTPKVQLEGYVLTSRRHSSGSGTRYLFSPPGAMTIETVDDKGRPVAASANVGIYNDSVRAQGEGTIRFEGVPTGVYDGFITVTPVNLRMRLVRWERSVQGSEVKIRAHFIRQDKPFARRTPMSYSGGTVAFHGL